MTKPGVGDTVRVYARSHTNVREDGRIILRHYRTLQDGLFVIVRANRHGDWTVSPVGMPGCTHDVFRDDVEKVADHG